MDRSYTYYIVFIIIDTPTWYVIFVFFDVDMQQSIRTDASNNVTAKDRIRKSSTQ